MTMNALYFIYSFHYVCFHYYQEQAAARHRLQLLYFVNVDLGVSPTPDWRGGPHASLQYPTSPNRLIY